MPSENDSQQNRLLAFANVFKGYMGVMPIVTAALAPILTAVNVLPTYESQRKPLATMAAFLGFLLLAWLFYVRRTLALGSIRKGYRIFFNLCPLILVMGSVFCYVSYTNTLDDSISKAQGPKVTLKRAELLGAWSQDNPVPDSVSLQMYYLGMFLLAESAFVMMAIREYANDVRKVTEYEWIFGEQDGTGLKEEVKAAASGG